MTSRFRIRPYEPGDEQAINDRFNQVFGLQRTLAEWRWKFRPEAGGLRIMVAVDADDQIIAQFAATTAEVQVDGRRRLVGQVLDVFSLRLADAVTQRVYLETARQFYRQFGSPDDLGLVFGFPGARALRLGRRQLNYAEPLPVPVWRRPATARRSWWPRFRTELQCAPAALDDLWIRAGRRYPVCVPRDGAWMQHRYLDRPGQHYRIITVWRRRSLRAFGVLAIDGEVGHWVDLVWDGADRRALNALDQAIAREARAAGAQRLEMWLSGDAAAADALRSGGWQLGGHDQGLGLSAVSFDPDLDPVRFVNRFYLTRGDSDLV
jgi:hypothetical protein